MLQKRYQQLSTIEIIKVLEVLFHKDPAKVHEMSEAMDDCKIAEVGELGVRLADYYDSSNAMELDFPKTPENDLILTSLYKAMLKTSEIMLQN